MQKLLIVLVIMLNFNQNVHGSSILDFMYDNIVKIKNEVLGAYASILTDFANHIHQNIDSRVTTPSTNQRQQNSPILGREPLTVLQNTSSDLHLFCSRTAFTIATPQLAATQGRILETHVTYTLDGYILTLHRLHSSKAKEPTRSGSRQTKRTVLLQHGLLGSSADWILIGPNKSLPYILADAGHDVWLANSRGNYYSRAHVSMNLETEEFWDFSWQEIGERDLPATLDYIRKVKNSTEPIDYIGHSMGATALLVLLSVKPSYKSYIRIAFLLAPLAIMTNSKGPLQMLATKSRTEVKALLGTKEFMPTRRVPFLWENCNDEKLICRNPLFFLTGSPLQKGSRTTEFTNQLLKYTPAGGSTKTITQYLELINEKKSHWIFNWKNIRIPVLIISSDDDLISNTTDNRMLYFSISNTIGHIIIRDKNISHTEFAWGFNADVLFYYKIRDMIDLGPNVNKV